VRERFEVNNPRFGIGSSRQSSDLLSRLQAHSDLRIAGQVQVFVQLQSDVAPGKRDPSPVDQDRLGLEQAFIALTEPLADGMLFARIGRQEVGFDLQRFLSVRNGPNVRQAYDGATVAYTTGPWRFIALYTDPVQNRNLRAFDDYSSPHLSFGLVRIER
jgi:Alginate export